MYCQNCGKELPANSRFCAHCGVSQDIVTEPIAKEPLQMCELHLIPKNIKSIMYLYLDEMTYTWPPFTAKEIIIKLLPGIHILEATIYQHKSVSAKAKNMVEAMTSGIINFKQHEDLYPLELKSGDIVYLEISMSVFSKVQIKEIEK